MSLTCTLQLRWFMLLKLEAMLKFKPMLVVSRQFTTPVVLRGNSREDKPRKPWQQNEESEVGCVDIINLSSLLQPECLYILVPCVV